jgi:hypothetical protein
LKGIKRSYSLKEKEKEREREREREKKVLYGNLSVAKVRSESEKYHPSYR